MPKSQKSKNLSQSSMEPGTKSSPLNMFVSFPSFLSPFLPPTLSLLSSKSLSPLSSSSLLSPQTIPPPLSSNSLSPLSPLTLSHLSLTSLSSNSLSPLSPLTLSHLSLTSLSSNSLSPLSPLPPPGKKPRPTFKSSFHPHRRSRA